MIVGATSGDTGSAAIDAVQACRSVDIVILYPAGRVSDVQRRQMTTVDAANVHAVAIEGTFDDCQDLVKAMFADDAVPRAAPALGGELDQLGAGDGPDRLLRHGGAGPRRGPRPAAGQLQRARPATSATCWPAGSPTGSGLPVDQLVIGSNRNDILTRFLASGIMATSVVVPTLSPSMDIQVSSNFERLLFELNHRDGGLTAEQLQRFRAVGSLSVEPDQLDQLARVRRRPL